MIAYDLGLWLVYLSTFLAVFLLGSGRSPLRHQFGIPRSWLWAYALLGAAVTPLAYYQCDKALARRVIAFIAIQPMPGIPWRDLTFWMIYLSTPVIVCALARASRLDWRCFTPPSVLLASYGLFAYAGIPLLYYQLDPFRRDLGINDQHLVFVMLVLASLAWVGMALGFWLVDRLLGPVPQAQQPREGLLGKRTRMFIGLLLGAALTSYFVYLSHTNGPALLATLRHDYDAQVCLRSQMTQVLHAGHGLWGTLFYRDILSFLCFFTFSAALTERRLSTWLMWLSICLPLGVISLLDAQKAPLLYLLVGLLLAYALTRDRGRLTRGNLLLLALAVSGGLAALAVLLLTGSDNLVVSLKSLVSRMLTGSLAPAYFYLKFFPAMHGYLHGTSASNLLSLLHFDQYNLTRTIHDFMYPGLVARGIVGSAPTAFWGEAYANFGPAGPFLVAVPVGCYVYFLQAMVSRLPATPVTAGLCVWLILHIQQLSITSFTNYLTDQHLVAVALTALTCYYLEDRGFPHTLFWNRSRSFAKKTVPDASTLTPPP